MVHNGPSLVMKHPIHLGLPPSQVPARCPKTFAERHQAPISLNIFRGVPVAVVTCAAGFIIRETTRKLVKLEIMWPGRNKVVSGTTTEALVHSYPLHSCSAIQFLGAHHLQPCHIHVLPCLDMFNHDSLLPRTIGEQLGPCPASCRI